MLKIAPSILSADFANLGQDCRRVVTKPGDMLHFDVMDGVFVPNISIGLPVLSSLKKAIPEAVYDVHLMIVDPLKYVDSFAKSGADFITFHLEAANNKTAETIAAIHAAGCKAGISVRPATPASAVFPYLSDLDMVLVMSVEPGFGGQSFMPDATHKIAKIRAEALKRGIDILLEVDGGINAEIAPLCANAGADILVAGSAVFGAQNPAAEIDALLAACRKEII